MIQIAPSLLAANLLRIGDEVRACELALVEACNNAVKYAAAPSQTEAILVDVLCSENQLELRVNEKGARRALL